MNQQIPLYGFEPTQATIGTGQGRLGGIGQEPVSIKPPEIAQIQPPSIGGQVGAQAAAPAPGGQMQAGPQVEPESGGVSGAMSGAATGASAMAMTGNPYAIAAGAVIGGALGFFS